MSLLSLLLTNFGSDADGSRTGKEKGGAPKRTAQVEKQMEQVISMNRLPQSIADTVTVLDDKERVRLEREIARASTWLDEMIAKGRRQVFSEVVTITPVLARLILQRNPENRAISAKRLAEIRADLENGHWVFNGESIIVSADGLLNDGQHRLTACRDTGVSMRTLMVFGVHRSARLTTDQGTARTAADYLSMGGKPHEAAVVAAVARLVWQYDNYGTVDTRNHHKKSRLPTKAEIIGTADDNMQAIQRSVDRVTGGHKALASRSLIAFCHFIFDRIDPEAAAFFIARLLDGTSLSADSPIYVLRQRLTNDPRMLITERFEAIVRAWNAYRQNRPLQKIQIMGSLPKVAA